MNLSMLNCNVLGHAGWRPSTLTVSLQMDVWICPLGQREEIAEREERVNNGIQHIFIV